MIQRETGGNLSVLLDTIAKIVRERLKLLAQVQVFSAEGRLSAIILGALPPVFLLYLTLVRFEYVKPMFTNPMGWVMLGGMAVMMSIGTFWLSKMVKLEV